ncbi:MAG: alanine--tRNA ligase [Anaerolineales bacterium]|nr:alanine--tRNA ligase [Anaerolineales bacterium]
MTPKKLTGNEIRQTFIDFFVEHGHTAVPSASLVPGGDSTLLFTNAGMVQFKDVFLGTDKRPYTRAVDSQKCMRVAGKHNDLEDVGRDGTHHTFFEMLGNWSFGDYYKKEAIQWAWQLLTDVWGLDKQRLYTTVFKDEKGEIPTDEEAAGYWKGQPGYDPSHLFYLGRKDNFWEMAETGPCGPCSEIHYDLRPGTGPIDEVVLDSDRFVELWNLVFIQYNRLSPTKLEPLPAKHVDTGMGFERIVSVLQDVDSNYKTDLFTSSLNVLRALTGHSESEMYADFTPYRVICDHTRSAAFLIADGVVPGNVGRNYVCRMIIRRAARFGGMLALTEPFLAKVAEQVIETYRDFYPELDKNRTAILDNLTREEVRFARTVETGTAHLQNLLDELSRQKETILDGRKAFDLYATYGLPFEITRDIAREQGLDVDEAGFRAAMDEHRIASGGGVAMGVLGGEDAEFYAGVLKALQADKKLGPNGIEYDPYTSPVVEGEILALVVDGKSADSVSFGDTVEVVLPKTGFYIESGGQVSDTGYIKSLPLFSEKMGGAGGGLGWEIEITDLRKPSAGIIVHVGEVVSGQPQVGDIAVAEVDMQRRHDIMRNHTATHLMHAALHQVLGESARQAGSLVAPDRLRFDFTHPEAMTPEQIERVEKIVNDAVAADMAVQPKLKPREEAIKEGAMALFGEKYGETVRTLTIAPVSPDADSSSLARRPGRATAVRSNRAEQERYSYELCGGTHLERTSDVGAFIITSEGSAAAGIRRIEAVTGRGAYDLIARRFKAAKKAATLLSVTPEELPAKVESLQDEVVDLRRELANLRAELALASFNSFLASKQVVNGINLLTAEIPGVDKDTLGKLADKFREMFPENGLCVIATPGEDNVIVMAAVTQDLIKKGIKAGDLVSHVSQQLGAGGGGAPHLAFGGGKEPGKVGEALTSVPKWVEEKLK